jgi:hypothetical protein
MKLTVDLYTYANATIRIELNEDELGQIAMDLGKDPQNLTIDDVRDHAIDKAYDNTPGICAQCSGWNDTYSLELNDAWDVADDDKTDKEQFRSVRIIK